VSTDNELGAPTCLPLVTCEAPRRREHAMSAEPAVVDVPVSVWIQICWD
jgi:hypothetical protein